MTSQLRSAKFRALRIVTIHAARMNLSQRLAEVEAGEEIRLDGGKTPVAQLAPRARGATVSTEAVIFVSAAGAREIATKYRLAGRLPPLVITRR